MSDESAPPLVDARTAEDVARQVRALLAFYAPPWGAYEKTPEPGGRAVAPPEDNAHALIDIFSRFAEIIIQRLNKNPEKNLLAFLDMLGISILPPQPARVPLTFFLTAGSLTDGLVPAGTQVAAPPAGGASEPLVFETERELTVVAARLAAAFTRDPARDAYADQTAILAGAVEAGRPLLRGDMTAAHHLYLSHERFLSHPALRALSVQVTLAQNVESPKPRSLNWEFWDGARWVGIAPKPAGSAQATPGPTGVVEENTASLTRSGAFVLTGLPALPLSVVGGFEGRWLRCRLTTAIPPADFKQTATRAAQLPTVREIALTATLARERGDQLSIEAAFLNGAPVDTSKDFLPFGEKPRLGDALYLAQSEAFSAAGATVTLDLSLTRPKTNPATETDYPAAKVKHAWEFWDGRNWVLLFTSDSDGNVEPKDKGCADDTRAFTPLAMSNGKVTFTFTGRPVKTSVGGVENFWVRVRIVSGDYGREAFYRKQQARAGEPDQFVLVPATFAPPTVNSLRAGYVVTETDAPDRLLAYNNFSYEPVGEGQPFEPFKTAGEEVATFYLGFKLPEGRRSFPNRVVSLYAGLTNYVYGGRKPDLALPASPPRLVWQYWDGLNWSKLTVQDGTSDLTRAGLVEFLVPPDFAPRTEFGVLCYWVRVGLAGGQYRFQPRARSFLLNTTMASQTQTVRGETLGSSDAGAGQKFLTTATPILNGQHLEVREHDRPSAVERAAIEGEEGAGAVGVTRDETGRPLAVWVRWHEVADFYGSGPRDRHYVLDHLIGEVRFGDGRNGMIPPRGVGNVVMRFYQTGGGTKGNRPAATITELKTTVPYVDGVSNLEPALGGADAESYAAMIGRGPRTIRHHDRAVTAQDYEDLSMMASPGVARVKCVPLQDLLSGKKEQGTVSLIVVPVSAGLRPLPDLELLDNVRAYLDRRRPAGGKLVIVGPEYVRVTVEAEVVPESLAEVGQLEGRVVAALSRFLHPLRGGPEGEGWEFGRRPHLSDMYGVIESAAGVGYVRRLSMTGTREVNEEVLPVDFDKLAAEGHYFLVYSGEHVIEIVLD
jgi:hypothetical protein